MTRTKILPPPIAALLSIGLMWVVDSLFPMDVLHFLGYRLLSIAIVIAAISVNVTATVQFRKAGTTIDPRDPAKSSQLVTSGLFAASRNPIYLAVAVILCAAVLWFGNPLNILIVGLFVWFITSFQIKPEEKALLELFGDDFRIYCSSVRRWI